jgi:hypothetical protein
MPRLFAAARAGCPVFVAAAKPRDEPAPACGRVPSVISGVPLRLIPLLSKGFFIVYDPDSGDMTAPFAPALLFLRLPRPRGRI